MAVLKKIVVQNYRNIELGELEFSPNVNCISGNNGEGKTNLMDAVFYLSMTKSAFASSDRFNFRYGTDSFAISGVYEMPDGAESRFSIHVSSKGEKKLRRDDKAIDRASEHIGRFPIVMVSPADVSLVTDSGDERRRFLNAVLSQMNPGYLSDIQQYNRLLAQRNVILKDFGPDLSLLEVFDGKMSAYADSVYQARKKFISELTPVVKEYYRLLSGGAEEVSIEYTSDLDRQSLDALLVECREKDLAMKYTTSGIQRDDLVFKLNGYPIRRCGSQGQQKSFLVALKFAQYEIMKKGYGIPPILLLDDVFDKLDMVRISNLLELVAGNDFGQIFITDSNKVRMSGIVDKITSDRAYFEAAGGNFTKVGF